MYDFSFILLLRVNFSFERIFEKKPLQFLELLELLELLDNDNKKILLRIFIISNFFEKKASSERGVLIDRELINDFFLL
jgi:hypothetical protein